MVSRESPAPLTGFWWRPAFGGQSRYFCIFSVQLLLLPCGGLYPTALQWREGVLLEEGPVTRVTEGLNKTAQEIQGKELQAEKHSEPWAILPLGHVVHHRGQLHCLSSEEGQHLSPGLSWEQSQAISEVQWVLVTLSHPCPPVLFAHLFSCFIFWYFRNSGIHLG